MRKIIVLILCIAGLLVFQSLNSCKHEFAGDHCKINPVKVYVTSIDASSNQANGSIRATALGGSGFQFSLNGGPFQDSGYFPGLQPFLNYSVVVKNEWGCTDTAQASINVFDPCTGVTIVVTATKTDASPGQNNGSITIAAGGGTGFTYNINGGNFQSSNVFTGLAAGNYTVAAKNTNGCVGITQVTINVNDPCAGVTVIVTTTQVNPVAGQSNGSITATATGGAGFTYSLNGGPFQTSGSFTGLAAGNYTVTAKNSNGCLGTTTVALGSTNPCAGVTITVSLTKTDPSAGQSNGSITVTATGGTGFTYSLNGGAYQVTGTFNGLAAGTYTVTAKNSAGCLGSAQITLTTANPCAAINIVITTVIVNNTPCVTPATGTITVNATGSSGFTYNINGGAYQASNIFTALAAGNYTVGVKDINGCTKTATVTIANSPMGPLFINVRSLISTRCNGSSCHIGSGQNAAGYNFDSDCNIVTKWSQINNTSVLYTPGWVKMPKSPQPFLTAAEKLVITNWINAGHRFTD